MFTTTVTQKGQVTIPVFIRKKLGITTGSKVIFTTKNKVVNLEPAEDIKSLLGSLRRDNKLKYTDKKADNAVLKYKASEYAKKLSHP